MRGIVRVVLEAASEMARLGANHRMSLEAWDPTLMQGLRRP